MHEFSDASPPASLLHMRSMDTSTQTAAERFGRYVSNLAIRAGFDLTPGGSGRTELAKATGMSVSAVGRMLNGKTLPMPNQIEAIARAVNAQVPDLLVEAGVISEGAWTRSATTDVRSTTAPGETPLTPQAAADAWGITDPIIREMLISNIEQAIRLQREAAQRREAAMGGP